MDEYQEVLRSIQKPIRETPRRAGEDLKAGQTLTLYGPDGLTVHGFQPPHGVTGYEFYAWRSGQSTSLNIAVALRDIRKGEYLLIGDFSWI